MNKLFIFARRFPYGGNEPYLETEIKYLSDFDEVHVFSLSVEKDAVRRDVFESDNIYYHTIYYQNIFRYVWALFTSFFSSDLYKELFMLIQTKRLSLNSLKQLFIYLTKSKVESKEVYSVIKKGNLLSKDDNVVLYSYRFDYASYMISKLRIKSNTLKRISRAHGIDLYEHRQSSNYLPFRKYILDSLDQLILISEENLNYALKEYPDYKGKFIVSYLGTNNLKFNHSKLNEPLQVLSISSVVPVKRVSLILDSIVDASDTVPIHWTHYGADIDFKKLKDQVNRLKNKPNLTVTLKGFVDNGKILEDLVMNDYHVFINLSTIEGLPVSIMEAMSVGIPAIATNAGGTYEIVKDGYTGVLVDVEVSASEVADKIRIISELSHEEYDELRKNAYNHWESNFSADTNYKKFVAFVLDLLN